MDEWNECFPCSQYVSIRYDNTRFHGYIPAFHLSMPRAFHRWDGHLYRRGLKICATSWAKSQRRDYKPELLGVKDHELRTVRNFSPDSSAKLSFTLSGEGKLIGKGNGDPSNHQPDKPETPTYATHSIWNGLARLLVQSTHAAGAITIKADGLDLKGASVTIATIATTSFLANTTNPYQAHHTAVLV